MAGNNANAVLNEDQLLDNVEIGDKTVQMFVNGQVSTEFEDYAVQDGDQIVLVYGDNPVLSLRNFDEALVDFQNGGYDKARFTDSAGNDHFFGSPAESRFEGPGFHFTAIQADEVSVTSLHNTDSDTAELHDTAMDDLLQCTKDQDNRPFARVWTPDTLGQMLYQLVGVETIDAYGTTGINTAAVDGVDFVELHGSWGPNARPVAVDDGYLVDEDASLTVNAPNGVLANDSDAESDSLTAMLVLQPSHGALMLNSNGSFVYTPNADFHGTDTFTYTVNDGTMDSAPATATLMVDEIVLSTG